MNLLEYRRVTRRVGRPDPTSTARRIFACALCAVAYHTGYCCSCLVTQRTVFRGDSYKTIGHLKTHFQKKSSQPLFTSAFLTGKNCINNYQGRPFFVLITRVCRVSAKSSHNEKFFVFVFDDDSNFNRINFNACIIWLLTLYLRIFKTRTVG